MIKADFYPDYQSYSDNLVVTDTLSNQHAASKTDDPLRAYYMGKLPNSKCKSLLWKDLKIVGTGDDKPNMTISLEADENRAMNWGYCMASQTIQERMYWASGTSGNEYVWGCKLINSMQAYCLTTRGDVQLTFMLIEFTDYTLDSGATIKGAGILREYSPQLTSTEYVNWMENGTDLELTFTDYGTITIKSQNCNENGIWELGNNKYIILHQIATDCGTRYTGMSSGSYINPFYCTTARSDGRFHAFSNLQRWIYIYYVIRFTQDFSDVRLNANDTVYTASGTGAGIVSKSRDISASAEALDYARRQSENTYTMFGDKQTIMKTLLSTTIDGKTFYQIQPLYNIMPNDAYITYCLINKAKNGNATSSSIYSTVHTVGMFNASNEPTGKRSFVTTYPALEPSLQQWQKYGYNINDDEFDPETPPAPEDWDPDTEPDDDPNDYEKKPVSQLNPPLFGSVGPRFWVMSINEFKAVYNSIKNIMNAYIDYYDTISNDPAILVGKALGITINKDSTFQKYSGFAGSNINDAIANIMWFPFDLTDIFATENSPFVWGLTSDTDFVSYTPGSGVPPAIASQPKKEVTGYWGVGQFLVRGGHCTYFKHYKNFIDYEPYCDAVLYVPYCGSVKIDPQRFVGHDLNLMYIVDYITGACLGLIMRDSLVVDTIPGQMGIQLPVSMANYSSFISQIINANASMTGAKIGLAGSTVSALTASGKIGNNIASGAVEAGVGGALSALGDSIPGIASQALGLASSLSQINTAAYGLEAAHMTMQTINPGSSVIATGNEQTARLVIYQPRWLDGYEQNSYGNYGHTTGFATIRNEKIENFTGLTIAESIDTSGISQATEKEKEIISKAFKTGVYI